MGMEKYDLAIKDYRKALKKRGPTAEIVSNLGLAYMRNDEPKNAVLCFERALEMEKSPRWKEKISKWLEELYQDPRVAKGKTGNKYSIPRHHPSKSLW
jgi:tetratricopeptide (TPR) repeat protein